MTVSKSIGSPHLMEDNGRSRETKKPMSVRVLSPPKSNSGMGHKVYVRRRPETELAKSHPSETQIYSNKSTEQAETTQENVEICTSDASPLEGASFPSFSSVSLWEERYRCLQSFLIMLDRSGQEDYLKMLRSMSCAELSKHALELEKKSIRLSLEEGREVQRMRLRYDDALGAKYETNIDVASHNSSTRPNQQQQQQLHN